MMTSQWLDRRLAGRWEQVERLVRELLDDARDQMIGHTEKHREGVARKIARLELEDQADVGRLVRWDVDTHGAEVPDRRHMGAGSVDGVEQICCDPHVCDHLSCWRNGSLGPHWTDATQGATTTRRDLGAGSRCAGWPRRKPTSHPGGGCEVGWVAQNGAGGAGRSLRMGSWTPCVRTGSSE